MDFKPPNVRGDVYNEKGEKLNRLEELREESRIKYEVLKDKHTLNNTEVNNLRFILSLIVIISGIFIGWFLIFKYLVN